MFLQFELFTELARIFSEDNNAWAQREVLMREGTAKFADTAGENDRHLQKVFQKQVRISIVSQEGDKFLKFLIFSFFSEYTYQSRYNPVFRNISN